METYACLVNLKNEGDVWVFIVNTISAHNHVLAPFFRGPRINLVSFIFVKVVTNLGNGAVYAHQHLVHFDYLAIKAFGLAKARALSTQACLSEACSGLNLGTLRIIRYVEFHETGARLHSGAKGLLRLLWGWSWKAAVRLGQQ